MIPGPILQGLASGGGATAAIPGIGTILGGLQLVGGLSSLFGSHKKSLAQRQQEKLSKLQIQQLERIQPLLSQMTGAESGLIQPLLENALGAEKQAQQYDPAKQTESLTNAYDQAARGSINADLGNITANSAARGFTQGTGDSDTGGMIQDTLAKRATARGGFIANLKAQEPQNALNITGQAFNRLQGAFGSFDPTGRTTSSVGAAGGAIGDLNNTRQINAAQAFDPTSSISNIAGGLKKVFPKMPWQ